MAQSLPHEQSYQVIVAVNKYSNITAFDGQFYCNILPIEDNRLLGEDSRLC